MVTNVYESVVRTLAILAPELILLLAAMGLMTLSAFTQQPRRQWCRAAVWSVLAALLALFWASGKETDLYSSAALNDALSFWTRLVVLLSGLVILGLAHDQPPDERSGEFFGSLLMMYAGTMLVAAANDIVFLFVGLELVSIPTYLLLYLSRRSSTTQEAATKYFYLSIFASALLLYGLAFLYGSTGLSNLKAMAYLSSRPLNMPNVNLGLIAIVFVMAGLCFRVAAVPLHFYAPDVYQGSPTVVAAVLSWLPKVVGFLAMTRALTAVFSQASNELVEQAVMLSWIIAAATMVLGNFVALLQEDLKRLLAYSSIAHAGYLMVGVTAAFAIGQHGTELYHGTQGVFFYLVAYALMTLGAFGVIIMLQIGDRPVETVRQLTGLGWTQPWPALALAICLLSLSGIPPLLGFWGKFEIFASAIAARSLDDSWSLLILAILGVLTSAVGAYYYLRIVVLMYLSPATEQVQVRGGWPVAASVATCASLTVVLGLFWGAVAQPAREAAHAAVSHPEPARPGVTRVADTTSATMRP
jgi:NADH-quinone oxidoreductase subunit N